MSLINDEDILYLSKKAVFHDQHGNIEAALYFYKESIKILKNVNGYSKIQNKNGKIGEYENRIRDLEGIQYNARKNFSIKNCDSNQLWMDRINFMLQEALDHDESNDYKEALQIYLEAADICIKNKKSCDKQLEARLTKLATQAIERAEVIKNLVNPQNLDGVPLNMNRVYNDLDNLMIEDNDSDFEDEEPELIELTSSKKRHSCYSGAEIDVLRHTSIINGIKYPPFLEGLDDDNPPKPGLKNSVLRGERFSYVVKPFNDPDGLVRLAPKQIAHFLDWERPNAISSPLSPTLFPPSSQPQHRPRERQPGKGSGGLSKQLLLKSSYPPLDWAAIRQTIISDCSFVASLTVCAHHEARFFSHVPHNSLPNKGLKRRYRPLVSNLIYPRDRVGLRSVFNPCGKYVVKLLLNGVPRKVVIDDKLPTDKYKFPLCSYVVSHLDDSFPATASTTNNTRFDPRSTTSTTSGFCINEFWVSILEKAYLKVMGGYDFPGSNSNIDLHALTGWIPERVPIINNNKKDISSDGGDISIGDAAAMSEAEILLFDKLFKKFHEGDVLVTLATGPLSDAESERTGLISTHAYALVDIRQVAGFKLFRLKNPWSHVRWKGNFSERDRKHWEDPCLGPQLKKALSYDITKYATIESPIYGTSTTKCKSSSPNSNSLLISSPEDEVNDDGLFWIDYKSVRQFFEVFYLNWDPLLFPYTTCRHDKWEPYVSTLRGSTPIKDAYIMCHNPQYKLTVQPIRPKLANNATATPNNAHVSTAAVWILLSRHITDKEDFAQNKEFITVLVYEGGEKIYYPYDPQPLIDGVRINSPHYLCKMIVDLDDGGTPSSISSSNGAKEYTLVISEYEKINTIYYTLRIYSTVDFHLEKIEDPYKFTKEFTHQWKGVNAGGCTNQPETYHLNPCFRVRLLPSRSKKNLMTSSLSSSSIIPDTQQPQQLLITLKAPKEYCVGIDLYTFDKDRNKRINKLSSGPFRSGFSMLKCDQTQMQDSQTFDIIPSTFLPGQEGPFILTILGTCDFQADLSNL